jgi:nucleotide-binding universal stress UspA family protein
MKNILLAIHAEKLEMYAVDFACYLANLTHSRLTGVFLKNAPVPEKPKMDVLYGFPYVETIVETDIPGHEKKLKAAAQNRHLFKEACANRGVSAFVHRDSSVPVKEIIAESRFADLLIVSPETSFEEKPERTPTRFTKEVLAGAECPVILTPLSFNGIEEILFACDGSPSSIFAIRQFSYLFPELEQKQVTVLRIEEKENPQDEAVWEKTGDFIRLHYSHVTRQVLQGKAKDELFEYLLGKKDMMVVMGSFGRSTLSRLFRPSASGLVLKTINLPIFITHC